MSKTKMKGKGMIPCNDYILLFSGVDKDTRGKEGIIILSVINLNNLY